MRGHTFAELVAKFGYDGAVGLPRNTVVAVFALALGPGWLALAIERQEEARREGRSLTDVRRRESGGGKP